VKTHRKRSERPSTNKLLGYCCVDSATLLITDPGYIAHDYKTAISEDKFHLEIFDELCETGGQVLDGLAVATSTRNGDGIFPVFAEYGEDGEIERVIIDFLAPSISRRPTRRTEDSR
jgi:hypothetical protein